MSQHMVATFPRPGDLTTVALLSHENDTRLMTVGTMAGQEAAKDYADMLAIARRRVPGDVYAAVAAAEPIGKTAHYRTPSSRWRRYDRMARFPEGLLVTGDAVCSFNPIYGQGMSVAALDAVALRHCLRRGGHDLPRRFHQASAKPIGVAWRNAVGADLSLPEIAGRRPLGMRINNRFADWVLTAIETDPVVTGQFFRVLGMIDAPTSLMRPSILARVARANLSHQTQVRESAPAVVG
jgi:2-polyprenyl-6-methoxyphenol hydroxylase-like FAD-dependent oxidoreductase